MVGYKFIIDGRPHATFNWFDGEVKMQSALQDWLNRHRCWDGADRGWMGWTDPLQLRPLCNYSQIDNTWLVFDWNHIHIGKAFRERFSKWRESMAHEVRSHIPSTRTGEQILDHHSNWLLALCQIEGHDWSRAPCEKSFTDDDNWVYSFASKKVAAAFKIVFGV
jgi:hypothetical protein